jgi:hypothetical protein
MMLSFSGSASDAARFVDPLRGLRGKSHTLCLDNELDDACVDPGTGPWSSCEPIFTRAAHEAEPTVYAALQTETRTLSSIDDNWR